MSRRGVESTATSDDGERGQGWLILGRAVGIIQFALWVWNVLDDWSSDDLIVQAAVWVVPPSTLALATYALYRATEKAARQLTTAEAFALGALGWLSLLPATGTIDAPWSVIAMVWWLLVASLPGLFLRLQGLKDRQAVLKAYGANTAMMIGAFAVVAVIIGLLWNTTTVEPDHIQSADTGSSREEAEDGADGGAAHPGSSGEEADDGTDHRNVETGATEPVAPTSEETLADGVPGTGATEGPAATETAVLGAALCSWRIGAWSPDEESVPDVAKGFSELAADLEEWDLCADGPVTAVSPGRFRQEVRSQVAGPNGWLLSYYNSDGEPVTDFIPPQVGQVYAQQPAGSDWALLGFPHRDVPCGGGRIQFFWSAAGVLSGYALWRYEPTPTDKRPMSAWFVPASVARGLIDFEAANGGNLSFAMGPPSSEFPAMQVFEGGLTVQGAPGLVLASEVLRLCPST